MSKPKSPWQPLASIPRDGTRVIVGSPYVVMDVRLDWSEDDQEYSWSNDFGHYDGDRTVFTHWMPIPPLPEGER